MQRLAIIIRRPIPITRLVRHRLLYRPISSTLPLPSPDSQAATDHSRDGLARSLRSLQTQLLELQVRHHDVLHLDEEEDRRENPTANSLRGLRDEVRCLDWNTNDLHGLAARVRGLEKANEAEREAAVQQKEDEEEEKKDGERNSASVRERSRLEMMRTKFEGIMDKGIAFERLVKRTEALERNRELKELKARLDTVEGISLSALVSTICFSVPTFLLWLWS